MDNLVECLRSMSVDKALMHFMVTTLLDGMNDHEFLATATELQGVLPERAGVLVKQADAWRQVKATMEKLAKGSSMKVLDLAPVMKSLKDVESAHEIIKREDLTLAIERLNKEWADQYSYWLADARLQTNNLDNTISRYEEVAKAAETWDFGEVQWFFTDKEEEMQAIRGDVQWMFCFGPPALGPTSRLRSAESLNLMLSTWNKEAAEDVSEIQASLKAAIDKGSRMNYLVAVMSFLDVLARNRTPTFTEDFAKALQLITKKKIPKTDLPAALRAKVEAVEKELNFTGTSAERAACASSDSLGGPSPSPETGASTPAAASTGPRRRRQPQPK